MDLKIKLQTGKTLKDVALKVSQFNTIAEAQLVNGPIKCVTTDPCNDEDRVGDVVTPPNEFGMSVIRIGNYRKLYLDPAMLQFFQDTFTIVYGEAVETTEEGADVFAGSIA